MNNLERDSKQYDVLVMEMSTQEKTGLTSTKTQTSVAHSSTESENISLDAGVRLCGIPALDLWDLIV